MNDIVPTSAAASVDAEVLRERMRNLRQRFIDRTRKDAAALRALRERWDGGEELSGALLKEITHMVHGLSGAAGIFGFDVLSEAAHVAECHLRGLDGRTGDPRPAFDHLEDTLAAVATENEAPSDS